MNGVNNIVIYVYHRFLSDDGLKKLNENGTINDVKELTKRALDVSNI